MTRKNTQTTGTGAPKRDTLLAGVKVCFSCANTYKNIGGLQEDNQLFRKIGVIFIFSLICLHSTGNKGILGITTNRNRIANLPQEHPEDWFFSSFTPFRAIFSAFLLGNTLYPITSKRELLPQETVKETYTKLTI